VSSIESTLPAGISPAVSPLVRASQITPFSILAAKAANSHHEVLRALCRNPGRRSRDAHLRHVALCLAYTNDPKCVKTVVDECGQDADALAVAFMAVNRSKGLRNVLPTLFSKPEAGLAISRLGSRMSDQLRPLWNDFLKPRARPF
jgi:hypothetical protein